ncbi:hypothetical protein SAMN05421579_11450 [Xenorhabdus japonica]|uniref:Phage protein D n=2 Tax=Xenorhabdus japonica TaxID=53341 RepID=A0A1I5AWE8_9GAMM|nr:hypothetical protein SAMN05421579_11450 [Xenorhabdus japonica]
MHIDQTNESDVSFLTRIAKQEGAIASVKNGELLFVRQGQNKTASGQDIPPVLIIRQSGDNHRFSLSDREAYTSVVAQWQDTRIAIKQTVKLKRAESKSGKVEIIVEYRSSESKSLGKNAYQKDKNKTTTAQQESASYLTGTQENVLTLSRVYSNKENAERAAKAVWEKMQRGAAQFSITLAKGCADIYPETPIQLKDFKPEIDGTHWTLVKVTHNLNDSGFTTSLDLEIKIDDVEIKY